MEAFARFSIAEEPKQMENVTPIYFEGVARGPIGELKGPLRECLRLQATLNLDFVGLYTLEVLCSDSEVQECVAYFTRVLGREHLQGATPFQLHKPTSPCFTGRSKKEEAGKLLPRARKNLNTTWNRALKEY